MTDEGSASHLRGVSANWTCVELGQGPRSAVTLPFQGRVGARGTVSNQTGTDKLDAFAPTLVTQAKLVRETQRMLPASAHVAYI